MMTHLTRHRRWLLAAGLVLILVASYVAGRVSIADRTAPASDTAPPAEAHVADGDDASDGQLYYCSMHPQIRSNDADDTCPICGMNLIPMPADAGEDAEDLPVLRLSERAARLLDIQTTPVERRAAEATIHFVGKLAIDETRVAEVVARSDSYVERLHANYLWMPVSQGEVIAELDSPTLTAAARELRLVQRGDDGPRTPSVRDAARARLDRLGMTAEQIDAALEADELPRTYALHSPISGVVAELDARQGDYVSEGDRLVRIVDLSSLWLELEAYESDLPWLSLDQSATFAVASQPGDTMNGTVAFIAPTLDDRTRTARVRLNVDNRAGQLRPGMFARGQVDVPVQADDMGDAPLLIPTSAALITGRDAVVYVRLPDADRPTFEGRRVTLGPRVGEQYIVRDGLAEGEHVVTHGAFKLDSELQIRGRPSMMSRAESVAQPAADLTPMDADAPLPDGVMPYPLDVCLVTDLLLDSMGGPLRYIYDGREILFCCESCPPRFEQNPATYLPRLDAEPAADDHQH